MLGPLLAVGAAWLTLSVALSLGFGRAVRLADSR